MNVDLNQLIPAFLAADDERRRRAMAVLTGTELHQQTEAVNPGPDRLLNQAGIAKALGVHPTTVRRWHLPCHRLGRVPRYQWHEVMEYLSSQAFRRRLKELKELRAL